MKHLLAFIFLVAGVVGLAQEATIDPENGPIITFTESTFDFGEITQGDVVEHVFTFENTGNAPLILSNVKTTCGCTAPTWPREAIAAGETAEILIRFNSRGKMGMQSKRITISSNAQNATEYITIRTQVKAAPPADSGSGN